MQCSVQPQRKVSPSTFLGPGTLLRAAGTGTSQNPTRLKGRPCAPETFQSPEHRYESPWHKPPPVGLWGCGLALTKRQEEVEPPQPHGQEAACITPSLPAHPSVRRHGLGSRAGAAGCPGVQPSLTGCTGLFPLGGRRGRHKGGLRGWWNPNSTLRSPSPSCSQPGVECNTEVEDGAETCPRYLWSPPWHRDSWAPSEHPKTTAGNGSIKNTSNEAIAKWGGR